MLNENYSNAKFIINFSRLYLLYNVFGVNDLKTRKMIKNP